VSPARLTALIKDQTSLADLQDLLQRHSSIVNAFHVTAALQWLVQHPQEQLQPLPAVVQQWLENVPVKQLTARDCANLAYYLSKLGYMEDLGLYSALMQPFMVVKGEANPQSIANLLYALGSQEQLRGLLEQSVLVELLQRLAQVASSATPQALCNTLWAAAKVEAQDTMQLRDVVAQLLSRFVSSASEATPQALSNTLYALALLPRAWPMDSALQLVERLVQLLPQAQPQEMANVVWALGQYVEQGWLSDLSEQSVERVMAAATQLLSELSSRAVAGGPGGSRSVAVTPQALANACLGMAKLQPLVEGTRSQQKPLQAPFSRAVQALAPLLPQAAPQAVANTSWACGVVRHYPQRLLQTLAADAAAAGLHVQQANAQEVSNLAWALAVVAPDPPPTALMASLLQRMQDLLSQQPAAISSQALANTAWAVAVLDQHPLTGQLALLAAAAFTQQWASRQPEHLRQWHQVHLWLTDTQVLGPAGLGAFPGVSQQQLEQCRAAWEERLIVNAKASNVQNEVAKVGMPPDAAVELVVCCTGCHIQGCRT
jgi:hypothetical protein